MKILQLNINHISSCIKLDDLTLNGLWKKQQWEKELTDPKRICLGASKSSILVGISTAWLVIDEIQLTMITVHPEHRREGVAKNLLITLLLKAKDLGIKRATLEVSEKNHPAIELYNQCGFIQNGLRKAYYKDGSNAILLSKALAS